MYQYLKNNRVNATNVPLMKHDFCDEATKGSDHDKSTQLTDKMAKLCGSLYIPLLKDCFDFSLVKNIL